MRFIKLVSGSTKISFIYFNEDLYFKFSRTPAYKVCLYIAIIMLVHCAELHIRNSIYKGSILNMCAA